MLRPGTLSLGLVLAAVAVVYTIAEPQWDEPSANGSIFALSHVKGNLEKRPVIGEAEYYQIFVQHSDKINSMVLRPFLPTRLRAEIPHFIASWLRNYIAGTFVYVLSGGLWCLWVYWWKKDKYFPKGDIPGAEPIRLQIIVSMKSMPLYTALPTMAEFFVENGWTRCYTQIDEVGWALWAIYFCAYMLFVEFFIYWMHRGLHDIKPLYKHLHATHHIYNKENTLSPFAGLAFNPIDGILQACPHVFALFVIPTHFLTHEIVLFCEAIWTTNIHDCIHGDVLGIMGAGYHTIHHTTYKHNYGHYTIAMDWLLGTLRVPQTGKETESKTL